MNVPNLPDIKFKDLPLSILPLSKRALNRLKDNDITNIGELLEFYAIGVDFLTGIGKKTQAEIEEALDKFTITRGDTTVNLAEIPLDVLALKEKTKFTLIRHNIKTVGDLLRVRREGLLKTLPLGRTASQEIRSALEKLLRQFNLTGWKYAEEIINNRPSLLETDERDIRRLLIPLSKALLTQERKEKYYDVIRLRFGFEGSQTYTLDDIGKYLEISREGVRQIEARAIRRVSEVILGKDLPRSSRVSQAILHEFAEARLALIHLGDVVSDDSVQDELNRRYGPPPSSFKSSELHFLMQVLGFRPLPHLKIVSPSGESLSVWTISNDIDARLLDKSIRLTRSILTKNVLPLPFLDLILRVSQVMGENARRYVPYAVDIAPDIEEVETGQYQIRFDKLHSLADKAYRILSETGEPLHYSVITRQINYRLTQLKKNKCVNSRTLISQLAADKRFDPIGRSGFWCLKQWNAFSKATIINLMKEFFHLHQKPATLDEVYEYVKSQRKYVSKNSIAIYLTNLSDTFVRVSKDRYELAEWGSKSYTPPKPGVDDQTLYKLTLEKLANVGSNGITIAELCRLLSSATGLTAGTIYRRIQNANWVVLGEKGKGGSRLIVKIVEKPIFKETKKHPTIRSRVQSSIISNLSRFPEKTCPIKNLMNLVISETKCQKPTFYSYLDTTPGIIKYRKDGIYYCKLVEDHTAPDELYPALRRIQNKAVQQELRRALGNLTVNNVDIGLFLLGKTLEQQLRTTLLDYREAGLVKFPDSALQGLSSAVNLAVQTGIIKEKHHLDFLRRERNERAHGTSPSIEERLALLKQAPYLAGLYIEYIALLEKKQSDLKLNKISRFTDESKE
ncbi:MAG: hypothetical protein DRN33_05765 [Thermoplasmata archaeon]|nr:MAG: hypothetical protein DRN33_05765 [Thermoplasmata archaeon]